MKKLIDKFKNIEHIYIIALAFFMLYLAIGILFSYRSETYHANNFFFEADNYRSLYDLTSHEFNHYRTKVHPIFVLLFQPISLFINILFKSDILSVIVLQSILGSVNIILIYKIFEIIKINKKINIILILIYGFSFSTLIFVSIPETFIFASFLLLLMWHYIIKLFYNEKKLNIVNYLLLILLGAGALSVTVTNFIQYMIAIFFLIFIKQEKFKLIKTILISILLTIISFGLTVGLATIQKRIWPTAMNFHEYLIDFSQNDENEEKYYMSKSIGLRNIKESYKSIFINNFVPSKIVMKNEMAWFSRPNIIGTLLSIILISFIGIGIFKTFLKRENLKEKALTISLSIALLYNFILHLIYGTFESFLYSQHFTFLVVLLLGIGFKNIKKNYRIMEIIFLTIYLMLEIIFNLLSLRILNRFIIENFGAIHGNLVNVYLVNFIKALLLINLPYSIYNIIKKRKVRYFILLSLSIIILMMIL